MAQPSIPPEVFRAAQQALRQAGHLDDPCGRCGCMRRYHLPHITFSYAKTGGSSGRSREIPVLAPTSCDCKWCLCSCVAFVEPEWEQAGMRCVYEPENRA